MLFLIVRAEERNYAVDATAIVEILPHLPVVKVAGLQKPFVGAFLHRGTLTPLIDFNHMVTGRPAARRLSTRILLIGQAPRLVGVLAEGVTETMNGDPRDFAPLGDVDPSSFLGTVASGPKGAIQRVVLENLIPSWAPVTDAAPSVGEAA